jgi:transposase
MEAGRLATPVSHPFYERLNRLLGKRGFDVFAESACRDFYAKVGRPGLAPGVYFRALLVGYFEGIDSERGIAWRTADSLALRSFLGFELSQTTPDHSTISRTRRLIDVETHRKVFLWVLGMLAEEGLLKGNTVAIDGTTLEANAALRSIVRRDTGQAYEEFLKGLAKESGIETPARAVGQAGSQAEEEGFQRRLEESARSGCADHEDEGWPHASCTQSGACGGSGNQCGAGGDIAACHGGRYEYGA